MYTQSKVIHEKVRVIGSLGLNLKLLTSKYEKGEIFSRSQSSLVINIFCYSGMRMEYIL
jgi:hypothetical protein